MGQETQQNIVYVEKQVIVMIFFWGKELPRRQLFRIDTPSGGNSCLVIVFVHREKKIEGKIIRNSLLHMSSHISHWCCLVKGLFFHLLLPNLSNCKKAEMHII